MKSIDSSFEKESSGFSFIYFVNSLLSLQFSLVTQSCSTLCDPMDCSTLGIPVHHHSWSLLKLMSIKSVMPSTIQPSHPLSSPSPLAFNLSQHQSLFQWVNSLHLCIRWPKYWRFSLSISSSNEYSGLISFRMDWLDLLAVQGTLKNLLQHHSSKASILRQSAFFIGDLWLLPSLWIWELDDKESWVLKNWYFWTVVLEKTHGLQGYPTNQS